MANDTTITAELFDQLLANYTKPEDLLGEEGLFKQLKTSRKMDRRGSPAMPSKAAGGRCRRDIMLKEL